MNGSEEKFYATELFIFFFFLNFKYSKTDENGFGKVALSVEGFRLIPLYLNRIPTLAFKIIFLTYTRNTLTNF